MLLSLLQCPVADPESEAQARKVSCKPSLRRPWEVSAVGWAWSLAGDGTEVHESERPSQGHPAKGKVGIQPTLPAKPSSPPGDAFS